jgi:hypothetical protein
MVTPAFAVVKSFPSAGSLHRIQQPTTRALLAI